MHSFSRTFQALLLLIALVLGGMMLMSWSVDTPRQRPFEVAFVAIVIVLMLGLMSPAGGRWRLGIFAVAGITMLGALVVLEIVEFRGSVAHTDGPGPTPATSLDLRSVIALAICDVLVAIALVVRYRMSSRNAQQRATAQRAIAEDAKKAS